VRVVGLSFLWLGAGLMVLSGVGVLRLPDVFARAHAGTKSASLGLACILVGTAILEPTLGAMLKAALAIMFQFATAPIAAHVIGRAAYRGGVPMWEGTLLDELGDRIRDPAGPPRR
jgi:multicomponent Na+:H+ antiporter subunit G